MTMYRAIFIFTSFFVYCQSPATAAPIYWNLFNFEEEDQLDAIYVTYGSLPDMLNDANRTGSFTPDDTGNAAANVVGSGSDGMTYWSLFNFEEEDQLDAIYVTYGSLPDMLNDANRTGSFTPDDTGNAAANVVGSGSDGMTYWSLFNFEEEDQLDAIYVTYGSLPDMLNDANRTGSFTPDDVGNAAANVIGSGSDGMTYWNLFNFEEEDQLDAIYVTYGSLLDMLNDANRTGSFTPIEIGSSAANVVGSGAFVMTMMTVPEPATLALFALGLATVGFARLTRKRY